MARRTPEEAEQTRKTLLETALALYAEHGIYSVSLKRIAAESGVTHGAVYWHFKSRDDLVLSLKEHYTLPFAEHYFEHLQAIDQNALKALKNLLIDIVTQIEANTHYHQIYTLFHKRSCELSQVPHLEPLLQQDWQTWTEYINKFLKQARKQKQLSKSTKEQPYAELLLCLIFGLLDSSHYQPKPADRKTLIRQSVQRALDGLRH